MLEKGKIIQTALIRLGNITSYNDDRSRIYKSCEDMMDSIISSICSESSLNFQTTNVKLTKYGTAENGEYIYNIPNDFLSVCIRPKKIRSLNGYIDSPRKEMTYPKKTYSRVQGEYIYSNSDNLSLHYARKIPLTEFPDYLEEVIVWRLACDVALINPAFVERLPYCEMKANEALVKVQIREGMGEIYE